MNARLDTSALPDRAPLAHAIRFLAADAVQAARSGHPGAPLGMAEIAVALWTRHLRHNPAHPGWADRDRFVLSNGHASMLLYALLHLTGYDLPVEELRRFRQLHSQAPGHPEWSVTPGVETTTGPLGQGLANAVGMALAEALLAREFNRDGHAVVDHRTWVFVGDGCLMEGLSQEVISLAGTLGLGKLTVFYDDNGISIDGEVEHWFADDTPARFEACGWHVMRDVDGHDVDAIDAAIEAARRERDKPSLIACRTVIGHGSPNKAGGHAVHGAPLGDDEIAAMRERLGWPHKPFEIPAEVRARWDARAEGRARESEWRQRLDTYARLWPTEAAELERRLRGDLPLDWPAAVRAALAEVQLAMPNVATRKASQQALDRLAALVPELLGGSADLASSNLTEFKGATPVRRGRDGEGPTAGRHVNYGVREFGMAAIMNGLALHGGYIPYGGTFLVFSDYARNAIRMAALMRQRVIFVLTHDSIGLGEDGPTHQPVEHVASLRLIPDLLVLRPCDAAETMAAWMQAIERRDGPTCLVLSRQDLPAQTRTREQLDAITRGGYVLVEAASGTPRAVVLASGSEVALALAARASLGDDGRDVRVVSVPSLERFEAQDAAYRDSVMPPGVPRVAVEAGHPLPWKHLVGAQGSVVGLARFGESAPAAQLFELFGFTPGNVAAHLRRALEMERRA
ncbi:transketolase [Dokdonella sp. MW10]|uniref:transketolase n=1 Tax=Dokdonella sp. MW10 TaxID=2992926 RepID=UPI003F7E5721